MKEFKKAGDKVTIEDVYESCRRYITNEDDMKLIKKAYDYFKKIYKNTFIVKTMER